MITMEFMIQDLKQGAQKLVTGHPKPATGKRKPDAGNRRPFAAGAERLLDPADMNRYWQMLHSLMQKYGPTNGSVRLKAQQMEGPLRAGIDPMNWETEIVVQENLAFKQSRELSRFMEKMNIRDPFSLLLSDVGKHEFGHWEYPRGSGFGCPSDDVLHYESFLQPAYDVLEKTGRFDAAQCERWAARIANTVEDVINNHNVFKDSKTGSMGNGQVLFWFLSGQTGEYSAEYTMFVKLNLALMGSKEANALLGRFFARAHEDANGNSRDIVKELGGKVSRLKAEFTPERMRDKGEWAMLTAAYAKELVAFINPKEEPEMPTSAGDTTAGKEGDGQGGKGKKDGSESEGNGGKADGKGQRGKGKKGGEEAQGDGEATGAGEQEGNEEEGEGDGEGGDGSKSGNDGSESGRIGPFDKLDAKSVERIMAGRKEGGKGMPFYLDHDRALDGLYRSLSRGIKIKAKHGALPKTDYPAAAVRRRAFDAERDQASSCDFKKIVFDPQRKKLIPTVVTHHHSIDFPIRKSLRGFPSVAFALCDASGSMMGGGDMSLIPWGDKSGYHYAVLAFYGLIRQLEQMGLLHKVEVSGATFSSATMAAKGLEKTKKMLLNPTSGGTEIDIAEVRNLLRGKEGALFPFISDGGIMNWESVKDEFIALAKKQEFFMIQVGESTEASSDIQRAGLPVYYVDSYQDVVGLVVDLTAKTYHKAMSVKLDAERMRLQGR